MTKLKSCRDTLRAISQFHESERLIGWLKNQPPLHYFTPGRRRWILVFGALVAGVIGFLRRSAPWRDYAEPKSWLAASIAFPILVGLLYLLYLAARHFRELPAAIRRRPQLPLHLLFWAALLVIWLSPPNAGLWRTLLTLFVVSLPYLLWRCGYMILSGQRGKAAGTGFRDHLFYLWPMWGGTNTPYGKGWDYLSQCEAQTSEAYARSVLAGIKLLLLALLWEGAKLVMAAAVYGDPRSPLLGLWSGYSLGIPRLRPIVDGSLTASLPMTWLSLYLELIRETLDLAAQGHAWIGVLRLFGFNVFRNTYKPLLSESIIDFWNRYYYYFKEMLLEFFFLPTYLRYFRTYPKLRIFVAVFAAAFAGNMYYHLVQAKNLLIAQEFGRIWQNLGPRLVYSFFLALGIYFSMLRQQKQRGRIVTVESGMAKFRRLRRIAGVWTFFALINFWTQRSRLTIGERVAFFLSLFGL